MTQLHYAPIALACPRCDAIPGASCITSGNWTMAGFHASRQRLADAMTDDGKRAALLQLQARQAELRRESEQYWNELYADPVRLAEHQRNRAAWQEAWAQMNERIYAEERERRKVCEQPFYHSQDCQCLVPGWEPPVRRVVAYGVLPVADLATERVRRR